MRKHREIIAPKFDAVDVALTAELDGLGIARWSKPSGGYFVNLDVLDGCAARVVQLAKEAGIALTPAGSAFPHNDDPHDRNIRLAPTFPSLADVETAMAGVATCVSRCAARGAASESARRWSRRAARPVRDQAAGAGTECSSQPGTTSRDGAARSSTRDDGQAAAPRPRP